MVSYGQLWSVMVRYGQLWSGMVSYGQLWSGMVSYGQLWSGMHPHNKGNGQSQGTLTVLLGSGRGYSSRNINATEL